MNKMWRIVFAILILILIGEAIWIYSLSAENITMSYRECNLETYIDNNYQGVIPGKGYIPNEEVAAKIGGEMIDAFCRELGAIVTPGNDGPNGTTVEYDAHLRLWLVSKFYINHSGGYVLIDQDTGEVINAKLYK